MLAGQRVLRPHFGSPGIFRHIDSAWREPFLPEPASEKCFLVRVRIVNAACRAPQAAPRQESLSGLALVVGNSNLCGARGRVTCAVFAGNRDRVNPAVALAATFRPQPDVMGVHYNPIRTGVPVSGAVNRLVAADGQGADGSTTRITGTVTDGYIHHLMIRGPECRLVYRHARDGGRRILEGPARNILHGAESPRPTCKPDERCVSAGERRNIDGVCVAERSVCRLIGDRLGQRCAIVRQGRFLRMRILQIDSTSGQVDIGKGEATKRGSRGEQPGRVEPFPKVVEAVIKPHGYAVQNGIVTETKPGCAQSRRAVALHRKSDPVSRRSRQRSDYERERRVETLDANLAIGKQAARLGETAGKASNRANERRTSVGSEVGVGGEPRRVINRLRLCREGHDCRTTAQCEAGPHACATPIVDSGQNVLHPERDGVLECA